MNHRSLVAAAAVLALAAGCTSTPAAAPPRAASPPVAGSSPRVAGGSVHLTAYTTDDGPDSQIVLAGAIGDYGTARSVRPDGTTDPEHGSLLELRLSHGTFRLDIAALETAFV